MNRIMKVGFIGFGNMAQALAAGLAASGALQPGQIGACARDRAKLHRNTEPHGFLAFDDAAGVAGFADVVVVVTVRTIVRILVVVSDGVSLAFSPATVIGVQPSSLPTSPSLPDWTESLLVPIGSVTPVRLAFTRPPAPARNQAAPHGSVGEPPE